MGVLNHIMIYLTQDINIPLMRLLCKMWAERQSIRCTSELPHLIHYNRMAY